MTGIRIRASTRDHSWTKEARSGHGGLYGVVTYFTGLQQRGGTLIELRRHAAWTSHRLHIKTAVLWRTNSWIPVRLNLRSHECDMATWGMAQMPERHAARAHPVQGQLRCRIGVRSDQKSG